jgi:hypothetical protein
MTNGAILRCDYAVSGRAHSAVKPSTVSSRVGIWAILSARRVVRESGSRCRPAPGQSRCSPARHWSLSTIRRTAAPGWRS